MVVSVGLTEGPGVGNGVTVVLAICVGEGAVVGPVDVCSGAAVKAGVVVNPAVGSEDFVGSGFTVRTAVEAGSADTAVWSAGDVCSFVSFKKVASLF